MTGVASAALSLSVLSTIARVYVRLKLQKFFGIEDYLTVAAVVRLSLLYPPAIWSSNSLASGTSCHIMWSSS